MVSLFKEVNNENLKEYINSIEKCRLNLTTTFYILESYGVIRNNPEEGINLLIAQLDGISKVIESEKSYQLFCELIGANFYIGEKLEENIPLFQLIKGISEDNFPFYPWQSKETCSVIYEDNIEELFINDLENTKYKIVEPENFLLEYDFDKTFLAVINEMKKFPRSREILNLYQNILLMKDFGVNEENINHFKSSFGEEDMKSDFFTSFEKLIKEAVEKGYKTIFENLQINFSRSKLADTSDQGVKQFIDEMVNKTPRALFLAHFYAAGISISEKINLKLIGELNESGFKDLQLKLSRFGDQLLIIKNKFGSTLDEINNYYHSKDEKDKELNELVKDVLIFFKNRDYDLEKNNFPTSRKLSSMLPGGPGIRKRINKLGGLTIFKQYFQNYIKNIQEKKYVEPNLDPSPRTKKSSTGIENKKSEKANLEQLNKLKNSN